MFSFDGFLIIVVITVAKSNSGVKFKIKYKNKRQRKKKKNCWCSGCIIRLYVILSIFTGTRKHFIRKTIVGRVRFITGVYYDKLE